MFGSASEDMSESGQQKFHGWPALHSCSAALQEIVFCLLLCPPLKRNFEDYSHAEVRGVGPPSHQIKKTFLGKIPKKLMLIKDICCDMTQMDLLSRCLKVWTQNPNESLHSKLWIKCSKSKFDGLYRVCFVSQVTALDHNFGYKNASLLQHLRLEISNFTTCGRNSIQHLKAEIRKGREVNLSIQTTLLGYSRVLKFSKNEEVGSF